jgi:hypothetical protein
VHNHFDRYLDLKSLILERRPKRIVECGAGNGDLTRKLSEFIDTCNIHVISDKKVFGLDSRIVFKIGLSYRELEKYEDDSIDLCIIDTDHNYWTLMKELAAVMNKITEGGMIALHDVETFYHDTGMALSYWDGEPYPKEEIEKWACYGGLGDALIWFLNSYPQQWKLMAYSRESNGAAIIEKRTQRIFNLLTPGPGAIFADNKKTEVVNAGI